MRKTPKTSGKPGRQCQCLFRWPAASYCHQRSGPSRLAGTYPSNSDTATAVCVGCVCALVRACACVCSCLRSCVRACMRACVRDVFAIYNNNIWPRLIMIIIKKYYAIFHTNRTHWWFPLNGYTAGWSNGMSMMLCYILYKVVIMLYIFLVWRVSHPSSCQCFVTDRDSLESFFSSKSCCLSLDSFSIVFCYYFDCVSPMLPRKFPLITPRVCWALVLATLA